MPFEFSLVITTYNRFDSFLDRNLSEYLKNKYISEIVISDDCSPDYDKLMAKYSLNPKVKIVQQPRNLGALKNKIVACTHASKEWICLMDSDNFCGPDYFEAVIEYWNKHSADKNMLYSPVEARPRFNFSNFVGTIINNKNLNTCEGALINLGNNVFHTSVVHHMVPILSENIEVYAVDAKYINYKLFKKGISLVVVPDMVYNHVIHPGSFYLNTQENTTYFDKTFNWTN
jgi:glycosyltransferase involved in cell wall biosynthesis